MPPPSSFVTLVGKFEHAKGQNLGKDRLFFWSSPKFGQENELNLNRKIFFLVFIIFKFPAPPLFENLAYATAYIKLNCKVLAPTLISLTDK